MDTVFITYNPSSEVEQTLAVRLHTIGAVNGFKMLLPDRMYSEDVLDDETRHRIDSADWFILFLTQQISPIVLFLSDPGTRPSQIFTDGFESGNLSRWDFNGDNISDLVLTREDMQGNLERVVGRTGAASLDTL